MSGLKRIVDAVLAMAVRAMDPHGESNVLAIEWIPPVAATSDWRGAIAIHYK